MDTSEWFSWGPLAAQKRATEAEDVLIHAYATEQYLQLLCWVLGLMVCLVGEVDVRALLPKLARRNGFNLTLGNAFYFVNQAVSLSDPAGEWERELVDFWARSKVWERGGYESPDKIAAERNNVAHAWIIRLGEAQRTIERHQLVIEPICKALNDLLKEEVVVHTDTKKLDEEGELRPAILKTSKHTLHCNALLMVHGVREEVFFVPHTLAEETLNGDGGGRCGYRRYGDPLGPDMPSTKNIRI